MGMGLGTWMTWAVFPAKAKLSDREKKEFISMLLSLAYIKFGSRLKFKTCRSRPPPLNFPEGASMSLKTIILILLVSLPAFSKPKFSSQYFDTAKQCECLESDLNEGQDCTQFKCDKMAGYEINLSYTGAACDSGQIIIKKTSQEVLALNEVPAKIEWRFAGTEPFAIDHQHGPSNPAQMKIQNPRLPFWSYRVCKNFLHSV